MISIAPNGGGPQWIEPTLRIVPGRDPLGLQTITTDRIMPVLVPGILALSVRARYLSFYAFLLSEYRAQKLPASNNALSSYVKAREYEYGLAAELCPHGCGEGSAGIVGALKARPKARSDATILERDESVKSHLGGYGLYYRSPLADLGLVAQAGTLLGDQPTHVDILVPDAHAEALADAFRSAIADTDYYKRYMRGLGPIPRSVLRDLAERACLCRLVDFPLEQRLLREALFATTQAEERMDVIQRRRSFALFLWLLSKIPDVAYSHGAFFRAIWHAFETSKGEASPQQEVLAQWAALVAKEYLQEALCSFWTAVCRVCVLAFPSGTLSYSSGSTLTSEFAQRVVAALLDYDLEELREWVRTQNTAISGLAFISILAARLPDTTNVSPWWASIGDAQSAHQPSVLRFFLHWADHHLRSDKTGG